jgi:hypothetical protein
VTRLPIYTDLAGIEGRVPVGATITIGTKGDNGAPTDRDRFYFKLPKQDASGRKPMHPAFAAYNAAPANRRQQLTMIVVHAERAEWVTSSRIAYRVKSAPRMADRRPWCTGDGRHATRYDHKADAFGSIACPNERCQYAQGVQPECKPLLRLYAQPVWPVSTDGRALPSLLCELHSHSWHSTAAMIGMLDHVETQARHLGIDAFSWFGFQFSISLVERTKPESKSRFPTLTFSPIVGVQEWLLAQARSRAELAEAYSVTPIASLAESTAHSGDAYAAIAEDLSGPKGAA